MNKILVTSETPMTKADWTRRNELERQIATELVGAFYKVGQALAEIRDNQLYRETHRTFEVYCKELFDVASSRAYQLIEAAEVYDDLRTDGSQKMSTSGGEFEAGDLSTTGGQIIDGEAVVVNILPANERQVRPLIKVPKEDRLKVWAAAVYANKDGKKPSGGTVESVVKRYLGEATEVKIKTNQRRVSASRLLSADMKAALDNVLEEVRKAKSEGYKSSSRLSIVQALDGIRRIVSDDGETIPENRLVLSNREKLLRAGFIFVRRDSQKLLIEQLSNEHYDWQPYDSYPDADILEQCFEKLISSDAKYLRD